MSAFTTSVDFKVNSEYSPQGDQPEAIRKLVESVRSGNRYQTLLGVTGSGKTFSMSGTDENPGIVPRSIHRFFDKGGDSALDLPRPPMPFHDLPRPSMAGDYSTLGVKETWTPSMDIQARAPPAHASRTSCTGPQRPRPQRRSKV